MRKHKRVEHDKLMDRLCEEFNEIRNLRFLSIIAHLYVEYFLDEIICIKFKQPELIIDNEELGSFFNKFTLLRSIGIFDSKKDLERNIEMINRIRNFYAHNMLIEDVIPQEIVDRINEMKYIEGSNTYGESMEGMDEENKFHIIGISTITSLSNLLDEV